MQRTIRCLLYSLFVVLFVTACSSESEEVSPEPAQSGFMFTVDPQSQSVEVEAVGDAGLSAQQTDEPRVLVPETELRLIRYDYYFQPGNILRIEILFRNVTSNLVFEKPFSFSVAPGTSNIVNSTEPTSFIFGFDDVLTPGETAGYTAPQFDPEYSEFIVEHKNEPFSYFVNAMAVVKAPTLDCDDPDTVVYIQSADLEDAIRAQLGLNSEPLTCARMLDLRVLEAPYNVRSLEGLQVATNLEELSITGNHDSYTPINNLTKLTRLDVSNANFGRGFIDLDLTNLVNLTHLDMSNWSYYYGISTADDVFPTLPKLTHLNISNSQREVPDLSNLLELTYLDASNLQGAPFGTTNLNLDNLANLTKLNYLDLDHTEPLLNGYGTRITGDPNSLANLTNLVHLDLSATFIDPAALTNLNNLTYLGLRRNYYDDISALLNNTGLADAEEEIDLTLNRLCNPEALSDIQTLEARNPNFQNVLIEPQLDSECP